jgi:hypothetical protein
MKILVIGRPNLNAYLEEVIKFSKHSFEYGTLTDENILHYDAVLLQWPEQLVDWEYPSQEQLSNIQTLLQNLKTKIKLLGFVHNLKPHLYVGENHLKLYDLVFSQLDTMIHFGEFSRSLFQDKYPDAQHVHINHSLYHDSMTHFDKQESKKRLGFKTSDQIVIVPGQVRTIREKKMILKIGKFLKSIGVTLVVLKIHKDIITKRSKGYYALKKYNLLDSINQTWFSYNAKGLSHIYDHTFLSNEDLSLWMSAADGVWIARDKLLNSGVLYLSLTYAKEVIGPNSGNIKEHLEKFDFVGYSDFSFKTIKRQMQELVKKLPQARDFDLEAFKPNYIAKKLDQLF